NGSRACADEAVRRPPRRRRACDQPGQQGQHLHPGPAAPAKGAGAERACGHRLGQRPWLRAAGAGGGRRSSGCGAAHPPAVERGPSTRKVRVLVVDDEAANRTLLTEALEPAGFTVLPASGGREAIEIAKSSNPDLVLLDLIMPEVTGFDVVAALRADEKTRDTPIMVLTAANLTEADMRQLNGRVSQILSRGSVATSDIVGLLKGVLAHRNGGK